MRHVSDRFEDEPRPRMPTEGVRILGAEEAQAALDSRARPPGEPERRIRRRRRAELEPILDLTPARSGRAPRRAPSRDAAAAGAVAPGAPAPLQRRRPELVGARARPLDDAPPAGRARRPVVTRRRATHRPARLAAAALDRAADRRGARDLRRRRRAPRRARRLGCRRVPQPRFRAEGSDWAESDFGRRPLEQHDEARRARGSERRSTKTRRSNATSPSAAAAPARPGRPHDGHRLGRRGGGRRSPTRPTTDADADAARDSCRRARPAAATSRPRS